MRIKNVQYKYIDRWSWGFLVFLSTSCVTPGDSARKEINGLRDASKEFLISEWGQPEKTQVNDKGETQLIFNQVTATKDDPMSGKILSSICDLELTFTAENLVRDWRYLKCGEFKPEEAKD